MPGLAEEQRKAMARALNRAAEHYDVRAQAIDKQVSRAVELAIEAGLELEVAEALRRTLNYGGPATQ